MQKDLARRDEDSLLRCPPASLHVSLGSFLFVREDYAEGKEMLWARHGGRWLQGLDRLLGQVGPFTLRFRQVVVTDSAVIALAECPQEVKVIRQALTALRSDSGLDGSQPIIVHTTLFRLGGALRDPPTLLEAAVSTLVEARFWVEDVVVTRELRYPSLVTEDLARLPLPHR